MGRRERERRIRRDSILDAAERIFARRGFSAATMGEVARESEFGMSTLYKFFNSKLDLYSSVIDQKLSRLQEDLTQIKEMKLDWRKAIERFISHQLHFFQENTHFFRIYMAEKFGLAHEAKEELHARMRARIASYVEHAEGALRQWIEEGHLGCSGAKARALALLSTVESYFSTRLADGSSVSADEQASLIMSIFFSPGDGTKTGRGE
ncbi:MAG: TetR/AcrR family transcriptional regulator [Candidatus Coatesbacteria bacterium]|nr:TetR/AcrR family transcriptional regulator [Candidatus Coatesbacteria bacterium]